VKCTAYLRNNRAPGHTLLRPYLLFLHQVRLNSDWLGGNLETHPELSFVETAQRNLSQVVLVMPLAVLRKVTPASSGSNSDRKGLGQPYFVEIIIPTHTYLLLPCFHIYLKKRSPRTIDLLITVTSAKPERLRDFITRSFTNIPLTQMAIALPCLMFYSPLSKHSVGASCLF